MLLAGRKGGVRPVGWQAQTKRAVGGVRKAWQDPMQYTLINQSLDVQSAAMGVKEEFMSSI
jgi:hypothetical protein